jgi:hypothetical protein
LPAVTVLSPVAVGVTDAADQVAHRFLPLLHLLTLAQLLLLIVGVGLQVLGCSTSSLSPLCCCTTISPLAMEQHLYHHWNQSAGRFFKLRLL